MNTRKSPYDLDPREGVLAENVEIDIDRRSLRRRPPLVELVDMSSKMSGSDEIISIIPIVVTPGFLDTVLVQISDGTTSNVYRALYNGTTEEWEINPSTSLKSVHADAKLRGSFRETYSALDARTLITDENLKEPVLEYDHFFGNLSTWSHNLASTDFYAQYCHIENERAWFGGIRTDVTAGADTTTKHLIVASELSNISNLSVSDRPISSLGPADPFYLVTPDLLPLISICTAFCNFIIGTGNGRTFILTGTSAQNYAFSSLYPDSGPDAANNMVFASNDVLFYNNKRVDTLAGVEAFGDVNTDDFSRLIQPSLDRIDDNSDSSSAARGDLYFDSVQKRVMLKRRYDDFMWVAHKSVRDQQAKDVSLLRQGDPISPWVKWSDNSGFFTDLNQGDELIVQNDVELRTPWTPLTSGTVQKTTLFANQNTGKIYYLDGYHANTDTYSRSNYPSGRDVDTDFTCRFQTKPIKSPSGEGVKNGIRGKLIYVPRFGATPIVTITAKVAGDDANSASTTVTLSNNSNSSASDVDMSPRYEEFAISVPRGREFSLLIEFDGQYLVELLGIELDVET